MSVVSFAEHFRRVNSTYEKMTGLDDPDAKKMNVLSNILSFALFIIASLAVLGYVKNPAMVWITLGIGVGTLGLQFLGGNCSKRKWDLISWTFLVSCLFALGVASDQGMLSSQQVGMAVMTTFLTACVYYGVIVRGVAAKKYFGANEERV